MASYNGSIVNFSRYYYQLKKYWSWSFEKISKKQLEEKLDATVFTDEDFLRQLKEVSIKTNTPYEVVESVVKHYILFISQLLIEVQTRRLRISIYGFFIIETFNYYYDNRSRYYWKRAKKINRNFTITKILKRIKDEQ